MPPDHAGAGSDRQDWTTGEGPEPDAALYLALNPDLAAAFAAGTIRNAAEHWRDCGRQETAAGARPALFDRANIERWAGDEERPAATLAAGHYLGMNPDLLAAFGIDEEAAVRHWNEHGSLEGRVAAGDAPYRHRMPDLAALLARPFGIDLYLPADEVSPAAAAGRRLLDCIRQARIPAAPRPFVERDGIPLLTEAEAARAGVFRISLIVASPQALRRLLRAYPAGHFDQSYVVAFWPAAALARHMPDYPTFGAVDELWVASATACDRLAAVAPVPVRLVELPATVLPSKHAARQRLGLPSAMFAVLLDAPLASDGQGGLTLADHVAPAIAAFRVAFGGDPDMQLLVRAGASAMGEAQKAVAGCANAHVLGDQRHGGASLPLAAADAMIASDGLDLDQADATAGGRFVLAPGDVDLAAALRQAVAVGAPRPERAGPGPATSERIRAILMDAGLDVPTPAFVRTLGGSRMAKLPMPRRPPGRSWSPSLPVLSILLDARAAAAIDIERAAAALTAQPWPFWELCIAGSKRLSDRGLLPADPRVRLAAGSADTTMTAALTRAATVATGSHVAVARDMAEAMALSAALLAIATHLASDPAADVLLASEPSAAREDADRLEAGGPEVRPVAFRRKAFIAAGGLRDRHDPASEYALLLALMASRARIARYVPTTSIKRAAEPPAAEEAGRVAFQAHLAATAGPLSYAEQGLRPYTYRRRTHLMRAAAMTVVHPAGTVLPALERIAAIVTTRSTLNWSDADLPTEYLLFLDDAVPQPGAVTALLEIIVEDEIGAGGGRVCRPDGTLHHGGLRLAAHGELLWPGQGLPEGSADDLVVHNPDAVGGGVLATRRSVLLQLGGFDQSLRGAGATFDLLAADFCLRCCRDLGLRTTYTPFAVFERAAAPSAEGTAEAGSSTAAQTLFRSRWGTGARSI